MNLHYTIHPDTNDLRTFVEHMESFKQTGLPLPRYIVADAGYGSEDNYRYSYRNGMVALIPYNMMRKEQKRSYRKLIGKWVNREYDFHTDSFRCSQGRALHFRRYGSRRDHVGGKHQVKYYECRDCTGCPVKAECSRAGYNRRIGVNPALESYKVVTRHLLLEDPKTMSIYAQRKTEPETTFGNLKANLGCVKFRLRGHQKVSVEFGLYAMAHDLKKMNRMNQRMA